MNHDLLDAVLEGLWHGAAVAVPTALLVAGVCALFRPRPATRHALWVAVLCSFIMPLASISITREAPAIAARVSQPDVGTHAGSPRLPDSPSLPANETPAETPAETSPVLDPAPNHATPSIDESAAVPHSDDLAALASIESQLISEIDPTEAVYADSVVASPIDAPELAGRRPGGPRVTTELLNYPVAPLQPARELTARSRRATPDSSPQPVKPSPLAVPAESTPDGPARGGSALRPDSVLGGSALRADTELHDSETEAGSDPRHAPSSSIAAAGSWSLSIASTSLDLSREWASDSFASLRVRAAALSRAGSDAFASIPRMPPWLWLAGICLIILSAVVRAWSFGRVLRAAAPADPRVLAMVADAARSIGLRRRPVTLMSDLRISPLVWCGVGPTLVLPSVLWRDLDDDSRRAIVIHELAHLKRHDHWVGWLALFIGIAYWWHPVVWWTRRRLAEEADLCCDAWVVSTLPSSRRAYAEALVTTRGFLATQGRDVPAVGLGVMSKRARRLARRLAMIMTKKTAPRTSLKGGALALALIGVSGLLGPAIACPPEEKAAAVITVPGYAIAAGQPLAPARPSGPILVPGQNLRHATVQGAPLAPSAPVVTLGHAYDQSQPDSTFEHHMQQGRFNQVEDRYEQLNQRLARLEEVLAHLDARLTGQPVPEPLFGAIATPAPEAWGLAAPAGDVIPRTYVIPEGRLGALVELMKRDDVPIYVSWDDSSITVNATESQHEIFAAFCAIICPEGVSVRDADGRPVSSLWTPDAEGFRMWEAFTTAAAPTDECEAECEKTECEAAECEDAEHADHEHDHEHHAAAIQERQALAEQYRAKAEEYLARHLAMLEQSNALAAQADDLEASVDEMNDRAEEVREAAQELSEQADQFDGAKSRELRAKVRAMENEARALEREARTISREAERARQRAEKAENEADQLQSRADDFIEQADEIAAAIDEMIVEVVPASSPR